MTIGERLAVGSTGVLLVIFGHKLITDVPDYPKQETSESIVFFRHTLT